MQLELLYKPVHNDCMSLTEKANSAPKQSEKMSNDKIDSKPPIKIPSGTAVASNDVTLSE
jgi:hypothetical protein